MANQLSCITADSRIIDLGAGYGGSARHLTSTLGCRVTALNLSETENERSRDMVAAAGLNALQPVLDRIHLETLGSPAFSRQCASQLGFSEEHWEDFSSQLPGHLQVP